MSDSTAQRNGSPKAGATLALAIACIGIFIPNYVQYQVSPLGPQVMQQYGLTADQLPLLFSAPMIPSIFLSLFAGLLIDKIGPKQIVGAGLIFTTIGCLIRVVASSYAMLLVGTMLTGISACFMMVGAAKILAGFYGPEGVNSKMGILMASSTIGMTIAMATSAYFPGVRSAFIFGCILALAGTVLWFAFMKNPESDASADGVGGPSLGECLRVVLKSPGVWLVSLGLAFIMGANVTISSYTPTVLGMKGIDATTAGYLGSCITLGNFAGCFVAPACVAKVGRQKPVLIAFALLAAIGVAFAWQLPNVATLAIGLFLAGMFLGGMIPMMMSLPVQLEEVGPVFAGTAGGILSMVQVIGAVCLPSYVIAPIAGGDFTITFLLGGVCMVIAGVFAAATKIK